MQVDDLKRRMGIVRAAIERNAEASRRRARAKHRRFGPICSASVVFTLT
jgi:hypothetical protein